MTVRVWVDGRLVNERAAAVSVLDHGITVGDGAFETAKVVDGRAFALSRHAQRLDRSLAGLGLPGADHGRIAEGVEAVLGAGDPIKFGRLRYTVTAGPGPLGSDRTASNVGVDPLTYIVTAVDQTLPPASGKVVVAPWTRNERAATAGLKTTSYADNVIALAYAKSRGALEAVFGNTRGELCECTGSNVFVVVDGTVLTPPVDSGLLQGITRDLTLQWCREDGLVVEERALPLGILDTADEVFITSSIKDVLPVHAVDDRILEPGPLTARAAKIFAARAAEGMDP
ncbi:MAG: aminotransferase class IV [Actinomycetota bacterium]|nr:aminotransferase class IV [Actinomycetota bacterium]